VKLPEFTIARTAVITNIVLRTALSSAFARIDINGILWLRTKIRHPITDYHWHNETRPLLAHELSICHRLLPFSNTFLHAGQEVKYLDNYCLYSA
jgi:hypothetical protein